MIDTFEFSDPFPRGQWWVKLPKIACLRTQRRYRKDSQTRFAVKIAAIFLSRSVCTVTYKTIVSTYFLRVAYIYRVLSVRALTAGTHSVLQLVFVGQFRLIKWLTNKLHTDKTYHYF